ncbi:MAG: hypothetical protein RQ745_03415 [Longimicrobiales bacterium]|nr:hypothetical protein [Longimicrobiales bacterium]
MLKGTLRALRFARSWVSGASVEVEETTIERDGVTIPATLLLPPDRSGPLPGWIALSGVSRMGRWHPQLLRFAGALSMSGAAVLIPEIPEWRRLKVAPGPAAPTIRGGLDVLHRRREVEPGEIGVIGFSFGAPQVAIAAAREELEPHIAGIVLFGGYYSLDRTLACMFTGRHEWGGVEHEFDPDPYGRWVLGANYLTCVEGCEDAGDVAHALHRLASAASGDRVPAWDAHHDPMISELRASLPERRRPLFDLFATPTGAERPEREACAAMATRFAAACRRVEPLLEPGAHLREVRVPTQLIHGRGDRLIPFTECLRLDAGLSPDARKGRIVTGLFSHTADRSEGTLLARSWEKATFFQALRGLINTVA